MENYDSEFSFDIMERGHTIRDAVLDGDYIQVRRAVETGTCQLDEADSHGRTVLHLAACRGHTEMIRLFLEHGVDVKVQDRNGNTPLHWCGHVNTVEMLAENGADICAVNKLGFTPRMLAERRGVTKDTIDLIRHLEKEAEKSRPSLTHQEQRRNVKQKTENNSLMMTSVFYEFYNDIGMKNMCLLLLGLLACSLYIAYVLTGLHLGPEERIPLDSQTFKIRL